MNATLLNGRTPHPFCTPIGITGFEVSCVAQNPFGAGFVFGSDDGKIKFTDEEGVSSKDMNGSPSGEAINGIASIGNSIAISSRQEVFVRTWTSENPGHLAVCGVPWGAHGISATPGGYYVAPLGETGIMMLNATSRPGDHVGVMTAGNEKLNFYRVEAQRGRDGKDLLICAARRDGIGIAEIQWGDATPAMRTVRFPELDVIDVCFVGGEPESPSFAAVARDGSIVVARDMLHDLAPLTLKFNAIKGRAYRLLSARGHLFLLTSSGLYVLKNLGKRLLEGLPETKFTTPILEIPLEAVDAALVGDRWLPVVMPNEILRFDLDLIDANSPDDLRNGGAREDGAHTIQATSETVNQQWESHEVSTESRELSGAC